MPSLDAPPAYEQLAESAAKQVGIDPAKYAALIKGESGFNPNAQSSTGVRGIAQLTLPVARKYNVDRTNPQQALLGGALYVRDLLAQYDGDYVRAFRAYKAGPARSSRPLPNRGNYRGYEAAVQKAAGANSKQTVTEPVTGENVGTIGPNGEIEIYIGNDDEVAPTTTGGSADSKVATSNESSLGDYLNRFGLYIILGFVALLLLIAGISRLINQK